MIADSLREVLAAPSARRRWFGLLDTSDSRTWSGAITDARLGNYGRVDTARNACSRNLRRATA